MGILTIGTHCCTEFGARSYEFMHGNLYDRAHSEPEKIGQAGCSYLSAWGHIVGLEEWQLMNPPDDSSIFLGRPLPEFHIFARLGAMTSLMVQAGVCPIVKFLA